MTCVWAGCPGSQAEATLCVHLERACGHPPGAGELHSGVVELVRATNQRVPSCDACVVRVRAKRATRDTACPWCREVNAPRLVRVHDLAEGLAC